MTPERWREVEQVYQSTMDREPRLRAAFLSEACGGDDNLRREVHSLLELNHSPVLVDEPAWQAAAELLGGSSECVRGTQLGPYRIEAILGSGGMGRVYQAHDTRLGRAVALKICRLEFNDRVEREARAVAALNHPNVCTIHDVGPDYLVMELVEGPTLADRMKQGPIPLEEALRIARQIADALEAAHEKGIVHRDLKPGNIKIKPDGTVKVLDFGLAKLHPVDPAPGSKPEDSPTLSIAATTGGMILGTAAYMSPEQARGKQVDKRADIWAFGVVLHEMLTGRRLFEGEDISETLALVLKGEPNWDGIPANLQPLLKSCLEKDPKRRLRDIGDAWRSLEHIPESLPSKAPLLGRLGTVASIVAAVAMIGFATLAFVHFYEKAPAAEVVRFEIFPPGKDPFASNDALLSPDGRKLAFRVRGPDRRFRLWVRFLDSLESRLMPGTEGALNASFWSPDSRFLAFAVQGQLKKIEVSGGPPQIVCDIPTPTAESGVGIFRAGAWNPDGVILFGTAATGLFRVSEAGGTPSLVTDLDPSRREVRHSAPYFLPDGRHFLYNRSARGKDNNGAYLGSLDVKPERQNSKKLLAGDANAVFAPSSDPGSNIGRVLFTREGSLMVQSFDLRRFELMGQAVAIADGMGSGAPRSFSVSMTGVLAYRTGRALGEEMTQLTWFDRQGTVLGTAGEAGRYNTVALSRDGARVAASRTDSQAAPGLSGLPSSHLWVYEFARGIGARLSTESASAWLAAWSPDGSALAFSSERGGTVFDLYQKVSSGAGDENLLLKSGEDKSVQDWSRDGRFLLYSVVVNGRGDTISTSHDLWFLPLTPGKPEDRKPKLYLKTDFDENQGQFSPDGRFVAFTSNASGRDEIYVQPFPTASDGKWTVSKGGGIAPRWRGDGKELFYISSDSKMMSVEVSNKPVFKLGIPKALFETSMFGGPSARNVIRYDVTSDGKKFLINNVTAEGNPAPLSPITVVMNWTALLKK